MLKQLGSQMLVGFSLFLFGGIWSLQIAQVDASPEVPTDESLARGEKVWFENSYGGEKFFEFLAHHPEPAKRLTVGFENVVMTPRNQRFQTWGVINDPDCTTNPKGGLDLCSDSRGSGVIGIRKAVGPNGKPSYAVSCASCHAGFDPLKPPTDLNEPKWVNIHPTIGNQYLESGKIFAVNLPAADPRRLMFAAWPKGTTDTTLIFNDHIMNPGVITAFWNLKDRPTFDVGLRDKQMRAGQGGEDDLGGDIAALRVYTNIGVCFSECVAPSITKSISISECREKCSDFPPQKDLDDLVSYLRSIRSPKLPRHYFSDHSKMRQGKKAFDRHCATCHSNADPTRSIFSKDILSNDEVNPLINDPLQSTNTCRALTSNWEEGKLWAEFSSSAYKKRVSEGLKGYRTMPLVGIWATAPFLHNQSVGEWAAPNVSPIERAKSFEHSMRELLQASRPPKVNYSAVALGPFPVGTPLAYIFNRHPTTGALLCDDIVENRGHHYGSELIESDKESLIYWLKSR